jgi:hypothetical protein
VHVRQFISAERIFTKFYIGIFRTLAFWLKLDNNNGDYMKTYTLFCNLLNIYRSKPGDWGSIPGGGKVFFL